MSRYPWYIIRKKQLKIDFRHQFATIVEDTIDRLNTSIHQFETSEATYDIDAVELAQYLYCTHHHYYLIAPIKWSTAQYNTQRKHKVHFKPKA